MNYELQVSWDVTLIDLWFTDIDNSVVKGLVMSAVKTTTGAPTATAGYFMPGALIMNAVDGQLWINTGTTASPVWSIVESSGDIPIETIAFNSDSTAGPLVIAAAKVVNAILSRDGGATNRADTTDTAAAMVALLAGAVVGTTFRFFYKNASTTDGEILTLAGGSGVTIVGNANVVAGRVQEYIARVTNVGTPALTLYAVNSVAGMLAQSFPASSVNTFLMTGSVTGSPVLFAPVGSDTDIGMSVDGKGAGQVNVGGTSTGLIRIGRGANKAPLFSLLKTDFDSQNAAPTAAQWLGGYITHNSKTGAGTLTTPTGAALSAAIAGVGVGDSFEVTYQNRGNQTVTLTAGDGAVTLKGTVAIPTLKTTKILFVNTGAGTWDCVQVLSA